MKRAVQKAPPFFFELFPRMWQRRGDDEPEPVSAP